MRSPISKWPLILLVIPALFLALAGCSLPGRGGSGSGAAQDFFKGKTINLILGYGPGSTFDTVSRFAIPVIEARTGAKVAIEHQVGGGGMQGLNSVYLAKPDGLTISMVHGPRMITYGLFKSPGLQYEFDKFIPIGRINTANLSLAVGAKQPWNKAADVVNVDMRIGASQPLWEPLVIESLGWQKARTVPGYPGIEERVTAVLRNELQATPATPELLQKYSEIKPLVFFLDPAPKNYPNVESVRKAAVKGKEKWAQYLEDFLGNAMYMFITTPGVPDDRVKFWEDTLKAVHADKAFAQQLNKVDFEVPAKFQGTAELQGVIKRIAKATGDEIKELDFVLTKKYVGK